MMEEFEITGDESSASDLTRMGRDQRGRVPDAPGQNEEDDADASEEEDAAVAERAKAGPTQSVPPRQDTDFWTWTGPNKLRRTHRVPRLVTFMPASNDCPVDPSKLASNRRTCACNVATRRSLEKHDDWRAPAN